MKIYKAIIVVFFTILGKFTQAQETKRIAAKDALSLDSISNIIPFGKWVMLASYKKQYAVALKCGQPICFMSIKPNKQKNMLVLSIDLNVYPMHEYPRKEKSIERSKGRPYSNQYKVIDVDVTSDTVTFWCEHSQFLASCKRFYWVDKRKSILFDYISQRCYTPESKMNNFSKVNWTCRKKESKRKPIQTTSLSKTKQNN